MTGSAAQIVRATVVRLDSLRGVLPVKPSSEDHATRSGFDEGEHHGSRTQHYGVADERKRWGGKKVQIVF